MSRWRGGRRCGSLIVAVSLHHSACVNGAFGSDHQPEQPAEGGHQPDFGLAPVLLRDQKDVEVGAERAPDIGQQEIDGVERARPEACCPGLCHCNIPMIPITSVITVSFTPTRKERAQPGVRFGHRPPRRMESTENSDTETNSASVELERSHNFSKTLSPRGRQHPPRQSYPKRLRLHPHPSLLHHGSPIHLHRRHHPQNRRLQSQHPTQRRQNPPCLGHRSQQRLHLRILQHHPQLRGKPRRMHRYQRQQPPKPPPDPNPSPNPNTSPRPTGRTPSPFPPKPDPPGPKPHQQTLNPLLRPLDPSPNQNNDRSLQPPTRNPRRHRPTQSVEDQCKTLRKGNGGTQIHGANRNISP